MTTVRRTSVRTEVSALMPSTDTPASVQRDTGEEHTTPAGKSHTSYITMCDHEFQGRNYLKYHSHIGAVRVSFSNNTVCNAL